MKMYNLLDITTGEYIITNTHKERCEHIIQLYLSYGSQAYTRNCFEIIAVGVE